jgi:hypothetical protein
METKFVAAGMAPNEFTATLWRDILADAGIESFLKPTEAATFLLASAILPVRVMVAKDRLEEARAIIAEVESVPDVNGDSEE